MTAGPATTPLIHVVLVEPEIPWNAGNTGRSCIAAGAQLHLVQPLGFSLSEKQVRRAGVHHWREVNPIVWSDLATFEQALPGLGTPFLFSARGAQPAVRMLGEVEFPERVALLFGRESVGLPEALLQRFPAQRVRIPLLAVAGISLNLSTAAGIVLYEVVRQRRALGVGVQSLRGAR